MSARPWLRGALAWMVLGFGHGCDAPETLQDACEDYCGQVQRARCENGGARSACVQDCVGKGTLFEQCTTDWRDYVACMSSYELTCDRDGLTQPPEAACEKAQKRLDACVSSRLDD